MKDDMTYDDLVNFCCGIMIEELCKGSVKNGVSRCLQAFHSFMETQKTK